MPKGLRLFFFTTMILAAGVYAQARAEVVDRIVAIVNDDIITLSKLNKATRLYRQNIEASQGSNAQKQEMLHKVQQQVLQQLVDISLTVQEAKKYDIEVTDADIDAAIENVKQDKNMDDASLKQGLAAEGLTLEDYRTQVKEQILQSMLINRTVRSKVVVTDADVQAYYEANQSIRKYKLKNIITKTEDEIKEVQARLSSSQTDFSELARNYSVGSNAAQGGDIGVFDISSFSEDISNAIKDLTKGQYTKILPAGSAFQIIYVDDIIMDGQMNATEAKADIQEILFKEKAAEQFQNWLQSLKNDAHVKLML